MSQSTSAFAQQEWAFRRFSLPTGWRRLLGWGAVSLGLALGAGSAPAQSTNWTNSSLGDWFIASNWSNGVPGAGPRLNAVISNGGTALINAGSFASFDASLDVGGPSGHGSLIIEGGALLRQFDTEGSVFANISGSVAVTDNGSYWGVNGPIDLTGSGIFSIESRANVLSASGDIEGNCLATVTGAGSEWTAGDLMVGGPSALRIYDHALVQADSLRVANTASVEVNNGDTSVAGLVVSGFVHNPGGAL
jgi:T5SS/PEP-CTERM-associated repeat protein